jgi:flavin reductase (DIM6/NTAB) family NADH-FMN oxidoreductase RutF
MTEQLAQVDAIFRTLTRELWIVTAAADRMRGGLTATWVSPASLDPARPVLLIGIAENHFTCELISKSRHFAAHLLRPDQADIAWNFACDSGKTRDKFAGLGMREESANNPVLTDCLAWLEARVIADYSAGDRRFFWGEVVAGKTISAGPPLTDQAWFRTLGAEQRQQLMAQRTADIELQRPLHEEWQRQQRQDR